MSKIYVGDVGTVFDLNSDPNATGVDLTGYTLKAVFKKPNGVTIERAAALKSASTTVVRYTTITGDIDMSGTWKVQIKATISSNVWYGETADFIVYDLFN